jgi:hypothetical protein
VEASDSTVHASPSISIASSSQPSRDNPASTHWVSPASGLSRNTGVLVNVTAGGTSPV